MNKQILPTAGRRRRPCVNEAEAYLFQCAFEYFTKKLAQDKKGDKR